MCSLCYLTAGECFLLEFLAIIESLSGPSAILGPAIQVIDSSLVELWSVNVDNHDFVL